MSVKQYQDTGKRKRAIARVRMEEGDGQFIVNKRNYDDYFTRATLKKLIHQPLDITEKRDKFNIYVSVRGGGITGQADAIKHGISKVLAQYDEELKPVLRKAGFLTRDARVKERKKYGQPGARKRLSLIHI